MPDIDEKYTLTEIAKELNVPPTFINRVQRETLIGPSIGTKGQAKSFDKRYVRIFRMVKGLRMIGFSFKDIKKLWLHEEAILKTHNKLCDGSISKFPLTFDVVDARSIKLVLHNESVYNSKAMDDLQVRDPYKEDYPKQLEILSNHKQEIVRKRDIFTEEFKKIGNELDDVLMGKR